MAQFDDIRAFYELGFEEQRLSAGTGALELLRTTQLLTRYLPPPPARVIDVGGGPGRYSVWLAKQGYRVHLIDPVPLHVQQATRAFAELEGSGAAIAEEGDARELSIADETADAVLLLGPLYHLTTRSDRIQALREARRVCRPGGIVLGAVISRFASTLDGMRAGYLASDEFARIAESDRREGQHRNPARDPSYFTTAYFHHPDELSEELAEAGLRHEATIAIEGPAWLLSDLDTWLSDEKRQAALLAGLAALETEKTLLGASAHLLAVGRR